MNHYQRLGVSPTADLATLRAAYRARVAAAHPDRARGAADERRRTVETAALNAAYAVLSDPIRRADYDRELRGSERPGRPESAVRPSGPRPAPRPTASTSDTASKPRTRVSIPAPGGLGRWFLADPAGQWAAIALLAGASLLPLPFGGSLFASLNFFCSAALALVIAQWAVSRRFSGAPAGLVAGALFTLLRALSPIRVR